MMCPPPYVSGGAKLIDIGGPKSCLNIPPNVPLGIESEYRSSFHPRRGVHSWARFFVTVFFVKKGYTLFGRQSFIPPGVWSIIRAESLGQNWWPSPNVLEIRFCITWNNPGVILRWCVEVCRARLWPDSYIIFEIYDKDVGPGLRFVNLR